MDAPDCSWIELVQLATNRGTWRALVKSIGQKASETSRWIYVSGYDTRSKSKNIVTPKSGATSTASARTLSTAVDTNPTQNYLARDTHAAFFMPKLKLTKPPCKRKKRQKPDH